MRELVPSVNVLKPGVSLESLERIAMGKKTSKPPAAYSGALLAPLRHSPRCVRLPQRRIEAARLAPPFP